MDNQIQKGLMVGFNDRDSEDDDNRLSKRSCCKLFKLETGVATFIYLDFLMFIVVMVTSQVSMEEGLKHDSSESSSKTQNYNNYDPSLNAQNKSFILFNLVTDYTTVLLFLIKMFYALSYGITLFG